MKNKNDKTIFNNFLEYWYFARFFSDHQKEIIFNSLSFKEQDALIKSCNKGGWDDVLNRNILDEILDDIKKETGYNLIDIRYKVLHNKSVYIPTEFWLHVLSQFKDYDKKQINYILGGIKAVKCDQNSDITLLTPFYSKLKE
jgi:hypothetical protein